MSNYSRFLLLTATAISALSLSSCTIYDAYKDYRLDTSVKPVADIPARFTLVQTQTDEEGHATHLDLTSTWWESFERPVLNDLVVKSFEENYDIAAAYANLKQAMALVTQTDAGRLPSVSAQGNTDKNWQRSDAQRGTADIGAALSWELDVFGRIGKAVEADRLEARARAEDIEALKLTLSSEIANAYFGAIEANQRVQLLQDQLMLDRDLQDLLQLRLDNGIGTTVDVLQQKAQVADSETLIPLAQADLSVYENRLDVLLGQAPDGRMRVSEDETLDFTAALPTIGVPAALLLNRPDLRAAKAELIAADADIAVAIADRLPQITLSGSYAYSDSASFTGPVAMIAGMFVQPLLDWGQRKAEVERNKALYEERLASYTQLFIEAVEEVENALIRENKQREFLERLEAQRDILQETVDTAEDRYTQGIDDYLPVISALQSLREVERSLITERLELVNLRIELFRAIGGPMNAV